MEICGNIFTNADYTEFYLKCIYCPTESNLKDSEQFVSHIRKEHSFDEATEGSVNSENQALKQEEFVEETDNNSFINEENEIWPDDDDDFNENYEYIEDEIASQSPTGTEVSAYPTSISIAGTLGTTERLEFEHDSNVVDENGGTVSECSEDNTSDESFEDESNSNESNDEPEETPFKRRRTNPLTLLRKLKISFTRNNPRVLQFIEEFKKHPCLWNTECSEFNKEKAKTSAYNEIIEIMDKKVNVLFTQKELKKSIGQLFVQYTIAADNSEQKKLTGTAARYFERCKFLSNLNYKESEDEESKSDVLQLNFKEINVVTTTFIDTYANFPVLYDTSLSEFKNIDARTQAYIQMSKMLEPHIYVNETEVHLAVLRLRKWVYMALRRVKSKELQHRCSKTELHYLQLCSFLPSQKENFVFICELCGKKFFIDYLLRAHMVKMHNVGDLPYLCSQCPRRFEKTFDMERHKLRQHCEKMIKCDYCESTFALKTDLAVHSRIHTGEKPFVCEICGKSFRLKLSLDYHINGLHLNLRPFKCDLCPKTFRKRVQLKNHMKAHLNIKDKKCDICGARFTCPTSLCRHRKTHFC